MVIEKMGLPDPPELDSSLANSNELVMPHADIELNAENLGNSYEGYQQLNADDGFPTNDSDSESDDEIDQQQQAAASIVPPIDSAEMGLLKEVWTESQSKDIEMDADKVRAVKDAMVNFTLPVSSIPDWATNIPEQEWKDHVLQKIHTSKSCHDQKKCK